MIGLFELIGIIGLLLISAGVLINKKLFADEIFVIGGGFLLIYSYYKRDWIFIVLQIVFILAATYDLYKNIKK